MFKVKRRSRETTVYFGGLQIVNSGKEIEMRLHPVSQETVEEGLDLGEKYMYVLTNAVQ